MQSIMEREAFSARLREALTRAGLPNAGPAELAREFNRRYPGAPVTLHATRKWLIGEAMPLQSRLRILADWLGVSAEWLRFGQAALTAAKMQEPAPEVDYQLMREIAALTLAHQEVVKTLVLALARAEKKSGP
jgi:transcriptional regulator with XRE-family HTH domain